MHRSADMFADLRDAILVAYAEVATRFATTERRACGEEVQRRPDLELVGNSPTRLDFIDAEPEAKARQAASVGDRRFDEPPEFVLRALCGHFRGVSRPLHIQ